MKKALLFGLVLLLLAGAFAVSSGRVTANELSPPDNDLVDTTVPPLCPSLDHHLDTAGVPGPCAGYAVTVSKTAVTSFTRTFDWDVDKSVTPETYDLFRGDSGDAHYTLSLTKDQGTDSNWAVAGAITIANDTPLDAILTAVTDELSGFGPVAVDCGVTFPYTLASLETLTCSYSTPLPDGTNRLNSAEVTTSGPVAGGKATANVIFDTPTTLVHDSVTLYDTVMGDLGVFNSSATLAYDRTFDCDEDAGVQVNIAIIVELDKTDAAWVTVNCHELLVTTDAATSFTRAWDWTIDKTADQSALTLPVGGLFQWVHYAVTVGAAATDSDYLVGGTISIANQNPVLDAPLTTVADLISPDIVATVTCPSYTVPAGGTLACSYSAALPDDQSRLSTGVAALQNYHYDGQGGATPGGTTDFTGTAAVNFDLNNPTVEWDECVDVSDSQGGFLGAVCADVPSHTFNYNLEVGPYDVCGQYTVDNTASFVTNDTGASGSDSWTISVTVLCEGEDCTRSAGYWKTHSEHGPAPYDSTWGMLADGADTLFFLSDQSYYEVMWTPPAGNVYYILARAYAAAQLNQLQGASIPPDVLVSFNQATTLFNTYTPEDIDSLQGQQGQLLRALFVALAGQLNAYNEGEVGPGSCPE